MTTYPTGVLQNFSAPGVKPVLRPVGEQNWRMFSSLADAQVGLEFIQTVAPNATMKFTKEGQYGQFVYEDENPDICVRIAEGTAQNCGGRSLPIMEYPSDIFDRRIEPQPFIDKFSPGQTPVLSCNAVTPDIGELFWTAKT